MGFNPKKYEITRDYIDYGNARSGRFIEKVLFLVGHDVGVPNSRPRNNREYFNNHQPKASAHTFIDDKIILEIIPVTPRPEKAFHVQYITPIDNLIHGDDANDSAIGTELCYGSEINAQEAYDRYVWYHAYLCYTFKLHPLEDISGHELLDPSRRTDPTNALKRMGKTTAQFKRDVAAELKGTDLVTPAPQNQVSTDVKQIVVLVDNLHTYKSADWNDKEGAPIVKKNTIFTVKRKLIVGGAPMYQLISGYYITANPKYVKEHKAAPVKVAAPVAPKPKPPAPVKPSYVGKQVKASKPSYRVKYYSKPTFNQSAKAGEVTYNLGFEVIKKMDVEGAHMYQVKNSKGAIFYITANPEWVRLI